MKPFILNCLICIFFASTLMAQTRHKMPVQSTVTRIIDRSVLYNEVLNKPGYDYHVICIYTNYCGGTKYLFQRIKNFDSMGYDQLHWVFCSSADLRDSLETLQLIKKNEVYIDSLYLIDNVKYKEKRSDDRYKGFVFRKDICEPCKKDIIGVPYTIMFNNKKEIVAHGYIHETEMLSVIGPVPKRKPKQ